MKNRIVALMNLYLVIISIVLLAGTTSCQKETIEMIETVAVEHKDFHICLGNVHTADLAVSSSRSAATRTKLWAVGQTVTVHFIGGTPFVQEQVIKYAKEWEQYANIHFDFVDNPAANIRISFEAIGSWSYNGRDALLIPTNEATMNFGWLTDESEAYVFSSVVLHEFGHALGLKHEQAHYDSAIQWDKKAVYEYYMSDPINWSKDRIDFNILKTNGIFTTQFCEYDPQSIMHYPIDNRFTLNDFEVGFNAELSEADKFFMEQLYPFEGERAKQVKCE